MRGRDREAGFWKQGERPENLNTAKGKEWEGEGRGGDGREGEGR